MCPNINSLSMSREGQNALKEIRYKLKMGNMLQGFLAGGTLLNALLNDKALPTIFNVGTTDWLLLGKAIEGIPEISKNRVRLISGGMMLNTSGQEHEFWEAIYDLCMFSK